MFRLYHFVNRQVHIQITSLQEIFQRDSSYVKHGIYNINKLQMLNYNIEKNWKFLF